MRKYGVLKYSQALEKDDTASMTVISCSQSEECGGHNNPKTQSRQAVCNKCTLPFPKPLSQLTLQSTKLQF